MKITFWMCITLVAYTYWIYPIGMAYLAKRRAISPRPMPEKPSVWPTVSIILCARDEGRRLHQRLANLCSQDYEKELLEIIVVSDGSTDDTVAVVEEFRRTAADRRLVLIEKAVPEGKAAGLNAAVSASKGEVLVMADARQQFGKNDLDSQTIRRLVSVLSDPEIGCVSGELMLVDTDGGALQADLGAYWRYEKWIRHNESTVDSVPGVTGAIYAIKRALYRPIPPETLLDDVLIPLQVILRGYRVVFDRFAVARDRVSSSTKQEWRRKVRTLAGNWQLINLVPQAFSPLRNRIWVQFMSHKFLRLIVPFLLLATLASSSAISSTGYRVFTWVQLAFYLAAAFAAVFPRLQRLRPFGITHTFVILNAAAIAGVWVWMTGKAAQAWGRPPAQEGRA